MPLGTPILSADQTQDIASIRVYPGADADFTLFSDDGTSYAYEKGGGAITKLHWNESEHRLKHEGSPAWSGSDASTIIIVQR